jgi:SAM-dependent methyltransferase
LYSDGNFLEVGCGQGRVLAFLKHKKTKWHLTGIESNPLALKICHQWADNTEITILEKDVFTHNISDYNIFFVGHPFDDNNLSLFIKKIENEVVEKVIVVLVLDIKLGNYISQRKGWSILQRETTDCIVSVPRPRSPLTSLWNGTAPAILEVSHAIGWNGIRLRCDGTRP